MHSALKGKARAVHKTEEGAESDTLLILEGLNSLAWSGAKGDEVMRLVRAVQHLSEKVPPHPMCSIASASALTSALASQLAFASVLHLHTTPSLGALPTDELFQMLHPTADLWIQVRGLVSGRSADVSGEVRRSLS